MRHQYLSSWKNCWSGHSLVELGHKKRVLLRLCWAPFGKIHETFHTVASCFTLQYQLCRLFNKLQLLTGWRLLRRDKRIQLACSTKKHFQPAPCTLYKYWAESGIAIRNFFHVPPDGNLVVRTRSLVVQLLFKARFRTEGQRQAVAFL